MCGGGGSDAAEDSLRYQKEQDAKRERRTKKGMSDVESFFDGGYVDGEYYEGFDDQFFDQRADAFEDYANPRVTRQFKDAQEGLLYGLADANLLNSSAAVDDFGDLDRELGTARDDVARRGDNFADGAREAVAGQRANLTNLIQSTADPTAIRSQLGSVADVLNTADSYSPVGNFFEGTTRGIGAYQAGADRQAIRQRVNQSYASNPSSGSGKNYG
jgi:hypothetical protein